MQNIVNIDKSILSICEYLQCCILDIKDMKCILTIKPNNVKIEVESGTKIIDAIRDYAQIEAVCGGKGICGKCVVMAQGELSPLTEKEKTLPENCRLACTTKILGDGTVFVPGKKISQKIMTENVIKKVPVINEFNEGFGVAFDIGTTTLAAYLTDLKTGEIISVSSLMNPQIFYGEDLIARIDFINNNSVEILQKSIIGAVNEMIETFNADIKKAVFVGNTCMNHILLGVNPKSLGEAPYKPVFCESKIINGKDMGINIDGDCYFFPNIDGFVGGDTVGVILSSMNNKNGTSLAVDIGTNGEIALYYKGELYVCSAAAGPAFEGGGIECGMRGAKGAIDKVYIENDEIKYHVIGDIEPLGICGSGLVDLVDCLIKKKIIKKTGRMKEKYYLSEKVYVSPKDVRNLQLAKGSISSGIKTLLNYVGAEKADTLYLAGGFGNYLNIKSAVNIGLLPKTENIVPVGNGAGSGAVLALINSDEWKKASEIAISAKHIELAHSKDYQDNLVEAMIFE